MYYNTLATVNGLPWKLTHLGSWVVICGLSLYVLVYNPTFPRPLSLFVLIAMSSMLIISSIIFVDKQTKFQTLSVVAHIIISGLLLRVSGAMHIALGSGDQVQLFSQSNSIVEHGEITFGGMYGTAPFYTLLLSINSLITGLSQYHTSIIILVLSILIPLFVSYIAYTTFVSLEGALVVAVLTNYYALYHRSGILAEAEGVAVVWFLVVVILLHRYFHTVSQRIEYLLVFMVSLTVFVHLLYSGFIAGVVAGSLLLFTLLIWVLQNRSLISTELWQKPSTAIIILVIGISILSRILWSGQASRSVWIFTTLFDSPDVESWFEYLIPSTRSAAQGVGSAIEAGTESTGDNKDGFISNTSLVLSLSHVLFLVTTGILGALYSLYQKPRQYLPIYTISIVLAVLTVITIILQFDYNLSYRFYYFASIPMIVFASRFFDQLTRSHIVTSILVISIIFAFLLIGPLVPLGNDYDPRFGGISFAVTHGEQAQSASITEWDTGGIDEMYQVHDRTEIPTCINSFDNQVWQGSAYAVCIDRSEVAWDRQ